MDSGTFLAELEAQLLEEDLADGSIERVLIDLKQYASWYLGGNGQPLTVEALRALASADLKDYRCYLIQRKLAPATLVRKFQSIRKAMKLLAPERLAQIQWVKLPTVQPTSPSGFTAAQRRAIKRAIENLSPRDAAICILLLNTGARASSIANAKVSGLTLSERSGSITYEGKGRKIIHCPLNAEARSALKQWLAVRPPVQGDSLFVAERYPYEPVSRWVIHQVWHGRLRRLLPPQVAEMIRGPHQARHDLARRLLSGDEGTSTPVPLADVAAILGHSDVRTTAGIYSRPSRQNLESALDRLSDEE